MKYIRYSAALLLALVVCASLVACGNTPASSAEDGNNPSAAAPANDDTKVPAPPDAADKQDEAMTSTAVDAKSEPKSETQEKLPESQADTAFPAPEEDDQISAAETLSSPTADTDADILNKDTSSSTPSGSGSSSGSNTGSSSSSTGTGTDSTVTPSTPSTPAAPSAPTKADIDCAAAMTAGNNYAHDTYGFEIDSTCSSYDFPVYFELECQP